MGRLLDMSSNSVIEQHYRENFNKLVKRMAFRVGEEWGSQDVVHEAYARALRYIDSFDGRDFNRWFTTILNNCLREHKNNEKGLTHQSFDEDDVDGTPCTHYPDRVIQEISDLIDTKSVAQIEVLSLHFKQGYSARDISKITEHQYNAVFKMIMRFRNELRDLYG